MAMVSGAAPKTPGRKRGHARFSEEILNVPFRPSVPFRPFPQSTTALAESLEVLVWPQFEEADINFAVGFSVDDANRAGFGRYGKSSLVGNNHSAWHAVGRCRHEQLIGDLHEHSSADLVTAALGRQERYGVGEDNWKGLPILFDFAHGLSSERVTVHGRPTCLPTFS
jgi:hypothetical protein